MVPVLPAIGRFKTLSLCAVPLWTTPSMIEVIWNADIAIDDLRAIVDEFGLLLAGPLPGGAGRAVAPIVTPNRPPVAILDAIDEGRLHLLAAIAQHRIAGHHAQQRGFAGAERHR